VTWPRVGDLRSIEFGYPGATRDKLNDFVLNGNKRATTGLLDHDYGREGEALEHIDELLAMLDSAGNHVATLKVTNVYVTTFGEVPWEHAAAEAEGDENIEEWRAGHRAFWARSDGLDIADDTRVVCIAFDVVERRDLS
jgi:uncharacterized protein YhfF